MTPSGQLLRVSPDGSWDVETEYDGIPNSNKIRNDEQIFSTDYKDGIIQLDPNIDVVSEHHMRIRTEPFRGCNDLHFTQQRRSLLFGSGTVRDAEPGRSGLSVNPRWGFGMPDRLRRQPEQTRAEQGEEPVVCRHETRLPFTAYPATARRRSML